MSAGLADKRGPDESLTPAGSDRSFGCTVGGVLLALGAVKALFAGAFTAVALLMCVGGLALFMAGIAVPAWLAPLHLAWLRLGKVMAAVANPVIMALLFVVAITPMALVMRLIGKRPLRLVPDREAASYWILRDPAQDRQSSMRRQF